MEIIERRMNEAYPPADAEMELVKDTNKRSADNNDGQTSAKLTKTD